MTCVTCDLNWEITWDLWCVTLWPCKLLGWVRGIWGGLYSAGSIWQAGPGPSWVPRDPGSGDLHPQVCSFAFVKSVLGLVLGFFLSSLRMELFILFNRIPWINLTGVILFCKLDVSRFIHEISRFQLWGSDLQLTFSYFY